MQNALDNLLSYTNNGLNDIITVEVEAVDASTFNPELEWEPQAYVHFTKIGSLGICEYWIRFTSNIDKNTEVSLCTIPAKYKPVSTKYQDTYNWGAKAADTSDDSGVRIFLSKDGYVGIRNTKKGPVNTIGSIVYINDDNVYGVSGGTNG